MVICFKKMNIMNPLRRKRGNIRIISIIFLLFFFILVLCLFMQRCLYPPSNNLMQTSDNDIQINNIDIFSKSLDDSVENGDDDDESDREDGGGDNGGDYSDLLDEDFIDDTIQYIRKNWDNLLLIGAVVAISRYSYRYVKKKRAKKALELERMGDKTIPPKSIKKGMKLLKQQESLVKLFEQENAIVKVSKLGDINITVLSETFLEKLNEFEWEEDEKEEFIEEMKALSPGERDAILNKMLEKNV